MKKLALLSSFLFTPYASAATPSVDDVLVNMKNCSKTIVLRHQALSKEQENAACKMLSAQETRFHNVFSTQNKPVANDNNHRLRANIYQDRDAYVQYVTEHFDVPSDNGGMYLEGLPHLPNNSAEFVAYQKKGQIWNLSHEYVHYLDGRFNMYGDFCANLHDSHSGPEYCPKPAPLLPHLVWWSEGIAEYIAKGKDNERAVKAAKKQIIHLSELFNTSYEQNGGSERVYVWGYLASRYMMEKQRDKVEQMLALTRKGQYTRYQALVKQWGKSMDNDFSQWLAELK
ncbi:Microbial collagenase precursor [Pseudoalteromonas sp. P1-9]|uniref:collagenase n=1 Tax=Pseudoalteromonas sp. P1-9 TaxID=1710354 RepID=UPI0006D5DA2A|nr:collagenase [Pseudoalteromonas sp. P1-9]KPV96599.1 Microbial collagenase precursor [Pseudoalteromonas sp. P1-9]